MSKLILAMNVSIDGYVDDLAGTLVMGPPGPKVFEFWTATVRDQAAAIYGRRMYELMRYWDEDQPEWDAPLRAFADAWRKLPKWVVSRTLTAVGPNTILISGDIAAQVRDLKTRIDGTISVSGPELAGLMTGLGLIDEYHLVMRPCVLGQGKPFFHTTPPPLRLISSAKLDDDTLHLIYAPVN